MSIFSLTPNQITLFLLIFVRVGAICCTAPIFSNPRVPLHIRAGISLLLAFLLLPIIVPTSGGFASASLWVFALLLIKEALVGVVIGYTANLVFQVVQMAGEIQDMQAGFGFAGVVDPNLSQHNAVFGQFHMVLMWTIFLTVNGHHLLLRAVRDSFLAIPVGAFAYREGMTTQMVGTATELMFIAMKISAPVIGAVLLSDIAMGLLQRTAPQLNLIAVGFQIKVMVAIAVVVFALPFMLGAQRDLVAFMDTLLNRVVAP